MVVGLVEKGDGVSVEVGRGVGVVMRGGNVGGNVGGWKEVRGGLRRR